MQDKIPGRSGLQNKLLLMRIIKSNAQLRINIRVLSFKEVKNIENSDFTDYLVAFSIILKSVI